MASRRDQLQSYQFRTQRVISAFVTGDVDPEQSPLRRGVGAVFAGVMVAVLAAAGFGIFGLLTHAAPPVAWQVDGTVVLERETGAAYVYLGGVLHPELNYTSALLASGRPGAPVVRVPRAALAGVPRGATWGIPGAPASLPGRSGIVNPPWTLCSAPAPGGNTPGGNAPGGNAPGGAGSPGGTGDGTLTTLVIGGGPATQKSLGDAAVLVQDRTDYSVWLIWHGQRFRVRPASLVIASLFGSQAILAPVRTAWLEGLPRGRDIAPPDVPGRGAKSAAVSGHRVGDLLVVQTGSGPGYYLVFADGLAPITELEKDVLVGEFPTSPVPVPVAVANAAPHSRALARLTGAAPPQAPPSLLSAPASGTLCAQFTSDAAPRVYLAGSLAGLGPAVAPGPTPGRSASPGPTGTGRPATGTSAQAAGTSAQAAGTSAQAAAVLIPALTAAARRSATPPARQSARPSGHPSPSGSASPGGTGSGGTAAALADQVIIAPGGVALVYTTGSGTTGGAYYLITDAGVAYRVVSVPALALLGYAPTDAATLPYRLVARLWQGRALDPAAATRPIAAG